MLIGSVFARRFVAAVWFACSSMLSIASIGHGYGRGHSRPEKWAVHLGGVFVTVSECSVLAALGANATRRLNMTTPESM